MNVFLWYNALMFKRILFSLIILTAFSAPISYGQSLGFGSLAPAGSAVDTLPGGAAFNNTEPGTLSYDETNFDPDYDPLTDTSNLSMGEAVPGSGGAASGGGGQSAQQQAAATAEKIKAAVEGYVMPTSTRNFSLSNLNSGNEASLIISSGNEQNNVVYRVIRLIAMLVGTVAILLYIVAGYFMIFSQGDENQLTKGKQIITFTSLGLVLAFGAYMIIQLVMGLIYFST